nr:MAG TPA: protein of unknown function (DUF4291) [Caudoviricetes sp.]
MAKGSFKAPPCKAAHMTWIASSFLMKVRVF